MIITKDTRQRLSTSRHIGDIEYEPEGSLALTHDVIPVIGAWKDFTGEGGPSTKGQMFAGVADKLWGTDAWVDGARNKHTGELGQNVETTRLRIKKIIIPVKDNLKSDRNTNC